MLNANCLIVALLIFQGKVTNSFFDVLLILWFCYNQHNWLTRAPIKPQFLLSQLSSYIFLPFYFSHFIDFSPISSWVTRTETTPVTFVRMNQTIFSTAAALMINLVKLRSIRSAFAESALDGIFSATMKSKTIKGWNHWFARYIKCCNLNFVAPANWHFVGGACPNTVNISLDPWMKKQRK